jgi:hypothetical protein
MSDGVVTAVAAREIDAVAAEFMKICPSYKVRKTASKTFRCMTPADDEAANWKKGLVYFITRFSKGVNLEMWCYSTKSGAHLAAYNDRFKALAGDTIKCEPLGHAVKLRIQIKDTADDTAVTEQITAFLATVEPVVTEVRAEIPAPVVAEKKAPKAKKEVVTPADGTVATEPVKAKSKSKSKIKQAA